MGEAPIWQVVIWEENRLDSCLAFEHREAVFACADGFSDCEGGGWGRFCWSPYDGGRAPCHVSTMPWRGRWLPQQPCLSYTEDVKCFDKLQMWISHTKTGSWISIYARKHFSIFSLYLRPTSVVLHVYLWQHLKTLVHSAKTENERNLHLPIFDTYQTSTGPLQGFYSPWSDVSLRALVQVKDIFSFCCELINRKNSTVIKLGTCVVNVLCHL